MKRVLFALALALPLHAQLLTNTDRGVVVAHEGRIRVGALDLDGVTNATAIVAAKDKVVVLDALHDEAVIADLASGRTTRIDTAATPIAAAFDGDALYILCRDARLLQRFRVAPAAPGRRTTAEVHTEADPAFLKIANGKIYVYARAAGIVEEIANDKVTRRVSIAPFASDFEISGDTAYLAYPRDARIRTIDLKQMKTSGEIAVGAVPVDLAFAGGGTAITARILAVADPSAKRVWLTEGTQSTAQAVARGFLRGFLGLGLFGGRSSQFPTGVDRVEVHGKQWIAYDSSSGTLYRFDRKTSAIVARNVAPGAFTLTENGVAWWAGTSVAQMKLE
jgi:hypothetical protein